MYSEKYTLKKIIFNIWLLAGTIAIFNLFIFSTDDDHKIPEVSTPALPSKISFAGEYVPLNDNDVKERLERELLVNTYWHSQTILFIKRANKFFPVIEPILKKNGIPDDFKYLSLIESGLVNVVSPSGAAGYWQFIESTGKKYNLEINDEVDERYHIEKSTEAFCNYMNEAYKEFGNWTIAAGSYNMGIAGMKKQVERQKGKNYYDLYLNDETYRYVFRIIAVKIIFSNPLSYGYSIQKHDLYDMPEYNIVKVDSSIGSLVAFAESENIPYKMLKILNPWLRNTGLSNKDKKNYEIKIYKN